MYMEWAHDFTSGESAMLKTHYTLQITKKVNAIQIYLNYTSKLTSMPMNYNNSGAQYRQHILLLCNLYALAYACVWPHKIVHVP